MKTSTAVAAGIGAVVVVVGVVVHGLGIGLKEETQFYLQKDGSGVCQPSDPDPLTSAWARKVRWTVTNRDCEPQYVSLRNFKHPLGGGRYDPAEKIVKPDPVDGGPVVAGTPIDIEGKIDKFKFFRNFKYEIWVGPTAATVQMRRDPDIDIWP